MEEIIPDKNCYGKEQVYAVLCNRVFVFLIN